MNFRSAPLLPLDRRQIREVLRAMNVPGEPTYGPMGDPAYDDIEVLHIPSDEYTNTYYYVLRHYRMIVNPSIFQQIYYLTFIPAGLDKIYVDIWPWE